MGEGKEGRKDRGRESGCSSACLKSEHSGVGDRTVSSKLAEAIWYVLVLRPK